ncbi:DUF1236 domain-containing protein [Govanella unica]|uniref:DUF1236 domain-containing protein n=1 Tax=Govanella unica TaxID=2975056 RepID=A0A9X3TXH6_9PROT|nr:DUF1236 domain-containing protein [Govania unica]MDA5193497.1 DUF1236 domain-containing protein [Govania unica]
MLGLKILKAIVGVAFLTVATVGAAMANGPGRHDMRGSQNVVVIDRGARHAIDNYYGGYYKNAKSCPRNFKFKHGVCRPNGWKKQRYVVGKPLPRTVVIQPMPPVLMRQLPPAPRGYGYRYVDGDVLLIADATHRVVDAVFAVNAAMNGGRR